MIFKQLDLYSWDNSLSVISKDEKYYICLSCGADCILEETEISKELYDLLVKELHCDPTKN